MPLETEALFVGYLVLLFAMVLGLLLLVYPSVQVLVWAIDKSTFKARMLAIAYDYIKNAHEFKKWKERKCD